MIEKLKKEKEEKLAAKAAKKNDTKTPGTITDNSKTKNSNTMVLTDDQNLALDALKNLEDNKHEDAGKNLLAFSMMYVDFMKLPEGGQADYLKVERE